jgi:hypothetical protein
MTSRRLTGFPRGSSSAAAARGSRPDLGSTQPRYLIRSARVQVLFSCWVGAGPELRRTGGGTEAAALCGGGQGDALILRAPATGAR